MSFFKYITRNIFSPSGVFILFSYGVFKDKEFPAAEVIFIFFVVACAFGIVFKTPLPSQKL